MTVTNAEVQSFLRWLTAWHKALWEANKPHMPADYVLQKCVDNVKWDSKGGY